MLSLAPWVALQVVAVVAAWALFLLRIRRSVHADRLFVAFPVATLGAVFGAVALGASLNAVGSILGGRAPAWGLPRPMAWGALFGFVASFALASRGLRVPVGAALDRVAPALGLLVLFGRLGCAIAGCDFGSPTDLPWAVSYAEGTPAFGQHAEHGLIAPTARSSLGVHPTQAYEALLGLVASLGALWAERRPLARAGDGIGTAALVYALGRFAIEWVRGDEGRGAFGPLSLPQWIAVAVIVLVVTRWNPLGPDGRPAVGVSQDRG